MYTHIHICIYIALFMYLSMLFIVQCVCLLLFVRPPSAPPRVALQLRARATIASKRHLAGCASLTFVALHVRVGRPHPCCFDE